MESGFGMRLRAHRERQQVALAAIAEQTKIKLSLLEGLERDDVTYWPRGIFRRSYVRAYAQAIGLDPDQVTREFLVRFPDPEEDLNAALSATHDPGAETPGRPPIRLRFLVDSAMDVLSGLRQHAQIASDLRDRAPIPQSGAAAPGARPTAGVAHAVPSSRAPGLGRRLPLEADEPAGNWGLLFDDPVELDRPDAVDGADLVDRVDSPDHHLDLVDLADREDEDSGAAADEETPAAPVAAAPPAPSAGAPGDLTGLARICTRLGCARDLRGVRPVLEDVVRVAGAVGVTLWLCDPGGQLLAPALGCGYPDGFLARLPMVPRDGDNALATAFRTAEPSTVPSTPTDTGAVVVPVITGDGCVGALAVELRAGAEQLAFVGPFASIVAAQLAAVIGGAPRAETLSA